MKILYTSVSRNSWILLIVCLAFSCGDDDDGTSGSIQADQSTVLIGDLNNCSVSSGTGTIFQFTIPYTATAGITIEQLRITTRVSNGDSINATNTMITDNGSEIGWATCFRYGTTNWVEYDVQLEGDDGSLSNVTTIRVERPTGAE